jgi:hypothetical protein
MLLTTGELACADGQVMCRRLNVGAVSTEAPSDRRRTWPSAQHTVHRQPPSAQLRPSAQHGVHRRPSSAQLQPSTQHLTSRSRRHFVTAPSGCADGYPRHTSGRRHSRLTVGPHLPPLRRLHVVPTTTHGITPGRRHNIWTFFNFTLFYYKDNYYPSNI